VVGDQAFEKEAGFVDIAYLNLGGTSHYLCSVLDGASRAIVHGDPRVDDRADVECILLRARLLVESLPLSSRL
jgi:hypothetical protein